MPVPLRILHAFSTFGSGGPQLRMAALINSLGSAFFHYITAMDGNFEAARHIQDPSHIELVQPPPKHRFSPNVLAQREILTRLHPDVLIGYNWGAMDMVAAAVIHPICPVLYHEHGFGIDEAIKLKFRRVLARRILLRRVQRVMLPSRTLMTIALRRYKLPAHLLRFIPNGVDLEKFRGDRNHILRRQYNVGEATALFGYVGRLGPEKDLGFLIRTFAAAQLTNAKLMLVGDGPTRPALQNLVDSLGVSDRVVFTGKAHDTAPYFSAFDVFTMSSVSEQMPMSLLEAMACGLPALCTDAGDTDDLLGHPGHPCVIPRGDFPLYVDALRTLAGDPVARCRIGNANRARCVAHYSAERMIRAYEEEFYSAAGRVRAGLNVAWQA
jgi:L-malate glycosyltransferase